MPGAKKAGVKKGMRAMRGGGMAGMAGKKVTGMKKGGKAKKKAAMRRKKKKTSRR